MAGNGDVAALIANVKPNYRHLSLSLIKIRHDTLLRVTSLHRDVIAAGTLLLEGSLASAAQLLECSRSCGRQARGSGITRLIEARLAWAPSGQSATPQVEENDFSRVSVD